MQMFLGLIVGVCIGSFIANFAHRWPDRLKGFASQRSSCENCGTSLNFLDLIPVLSWIILRGHCRHCGAKVPSSYTIVEFLAGLIGFLSLLVLDPISGWLAACVGWVLLTMALIDLRHFILPNILTWPLLASGVGIALLAEISTESWPGPSLIEALLGSSVGFFGLWLVREVYRRFRGREGLGLGDVKLFGGAGAWCGAEALTWVLLIGAVTGLIMGLRRGHGLKSAKPVPFGPALAMAFWLVMLSQWSS